MNPIGRLFYGASTMAGVPGALAQDCCATLGAQAGEEKLKEICNQAGLPVSAEQQKRRST